MRTKLVALLDRIAYYEWAYGHLAESDADIGPIGEFVVARQLGCPLPPRKVNALYDLISPEGIPLEIKTTTKKSTPGKGNPYYRWCISEQSECLAGRRPLANYWLFLIATFPPKSPTQRRFDVFDTKYWQCYLVTGEQVRTIAGNRYVTERGLRRLGLTSQPLRSIQLPRQ